MNIVSQKALSQYIRVATSAYSDCLRALAAKMGPEGKGRGLWDVVLSSLGSQGIQESHSGRAAIWHVFGFDTKVRGGEAFEASRTNHAFRSLQCCIKVKRSICLQDHRRSLCIPPQDRDLLKLLHAQLPHIGFGPGRSIVD